MQWPLQLQVQGGRQYPGGLQQLLCTTQAKAMSTHARAPGIPVPIAVAVSMNWAAGR